MQLPDWAQPFAERSAAWKIALGGRGSAKSHTLVRLALLLGTQRRLTVLCLREVRENLDDSLLPLIRGVLLEDPALAASYRPLSRLVRGANGTEFRFGGLSEVHGTAKGIRGAEGVDVFLIDEGQYITPESMLHLTPTIREEGAEAWVALNPRYEDDPLCQLAECGDSDVLAWRVNWRDNPFWSERQEAERVRFKRMFPSLYAHVYEGELMPDAVGRMFDCSRLGYVDKLPDGCELARGWDWASSVAVTGDRTAGVLVGQLGEGEDARWYVADVVCGRWPPGEVMSRAKAAARRDGVEVMQVYEEEAGGAGANWVQSLVTAVAPVPARGVKPSGQKDVRARGFAAQVAAGNVSLVRGGWNAGYVRELSRFPDEGRHDDQVDGSAYAFEHLAGARRVGSWEDMLALARAV